jgi:probable DNA metabolism protein
MHAAVLAHEVDWEGYRALVRTLAQARIPPEHVAWSVRDIDDLFAEALPERSASPGLRVPRELATLAETVIQSSEPARFGLLYRLIWRAVTGERHVLEQITDPEVHRANRLAQSVRRDTHKMRAFVRFRDVTDDGVPRHLAWFEPDHYIVEANASFFVRRFASMTWSILTPYRCAHWNGDRLAFTDGARLADVPQDDEIAAYWQAYFGATFNPARLKIGAMTAEMPRKYWKNLPEAAMIPELIAGAAVRTQTMIDTPKISPARPTNRPGATEEPPPIMPIARARLEAKQCQRCPLYATATQTVFGEGPTTASIVLVGEQPGDQEDLAGRPFVGPAGQLLDRALHEAALDRSQLYVTNAVKHFKFIPRGKRRMHMKPDASEIDACRWWLDIELNDIVPKVVILLGATAGRAVLGRPVSVMKERGRPIPLGAGMAVQTVHPSFLLRLPDPAAKAREYSAFLADLRLAATLLDPHIDVEGEPT